EGELVTLTLDLDARTGSLLTQFFFLLVHVDTNACAGDCADRCADGRVPLVVAASHHAGACAKDGAGCSCGPDALAGTGFTCMHQRKRQSCCEEDRLLHEEDSLCLKYVAACRTPYL